MSKLKNNLIKKIIDIDNDEDLIKYLETFVKIMKTNNKKEHVTSWAWGGGAGGSIRNVDMSSLSHLYYDFPSDELTD